MTEITWIETALDSPRELEASFANVRIASALRNVPDHSLSDVGEIARVLGVEKLTLIRCVREDTKLARLVASKVLK